MKPEKHKAAWIPPTTEAELKEIDEAKEECARRLGNIAHFLMTIDPIAANEIVRMQYEIALLGIKISHEIMYW